MMRKSTEVQRWSAGPPLFGPLGGSACATVQPPVASLSRNELAVHQADESNASQYAPMELQSARDKLDEAQLALGIQEYERVRHLAELALADAWVAEVRAETEGGRQTARDLRLRLEVLWAEAVRLAALY